MKEVRKGIKIRIKGYNSETFGDEVNSLISEIDSADIATDSDALTSEKINDFLQRIDSMLLTIKKIDIAEVNDQRVKLQSYQKKLQKKGLVIDGNNLIREIDGAFNPTDSGLLADKEIVGFLDRISRLANEAESLGSSARPLPGQELSNDDTQLKSLYETLQSKREVLQKAEYELAVAEFDKRLAALEAKQEARRKAATKIQSVVRGRAARKVVSAEKAERLAAEKAAAAERQAAATRVAVEREVKRVAAARQEIEGALQEKRSAELKRKVEEALQGQEPKKVVQEAREIVRLANEKIALINNAQKCKTLKRIASSESTETGEVLGLEEIKQYSFSSLKEMNEIAIEALNELAYIRAIMTERAMETYKAVLNAKDAGEEAAFLEAGVELAVGVIQEVVSIKSTFDEDVDGVVYAVIRLQLAAEIATIKKIYTNQVSDLFAERIDNFYSKIDEANKSIETVKGMHGSTLASKSPGSIEEKQELEQKLEQERKLWQGIKDATGELRAYKKPVEKLVEARGKLLSSSISQEEVGKGTDDEMSLSSISRELKEVCKHIEKLQPSSDDVRSRVQTLLKKLNFLDVVKNDSVSSVKEVVTSLNNVISAIDVFKTEKLSGPLIEVLEGKPSQQLGTEVATAEQAARVAAAKAAAKAAAEKAAAEAERLAALQKFEWAATNVVYILQANRQAIWKVQSIKEQSVNSQSGGLQEEYQNLLDKMSKLNVGHFMSAFDSFVEKIEKAELKAANLPSTTASEREQITAEGRVQSAKEEVKKLMQECD